MDPRDDPVEQFRRARERYVLGDVDVARSDFLAVVIRANAPDSTVPFEVWAEAWVYLGEIQILQGRQQDAKPYFAKVLARDPDYRLSPYEHPAVVIETFNTQREAGPALTRPRPMPWWGYAPFGVPQFQQRRPVRGTVYAILQVGFAAASVAAWVVIDQQVGLYEAGGYPDDVQIRLRDRAVLLRDAFSTSTAGAFYATWAVSVVDGGLSWRKDQLAPPRLAVVPRRDGVAVQVGWTF